VSTSRLEDALSYLHDVLRDPDATRSDRIAAAKAIVSKDARESASLPWDGKRQSDVVKLQLEYVDSDGNPVEPQP
jgi:hypothetical protein